MIARQRARLWFFIYRGGATACGILPFIVASVLGDLFGAAWYRFARGARDNVRANLAHILGTSVDAAVREQHVRAVFRSYGRYWTELASVAQRTDRLAKMQFEMLGREHIESARRDGRGVILALGHVGAWDIGGSLMTKWGIPLTTVEESATSQELSEWFLAQRAGLGLTTLPLDNNSGRELMKVLHSGGLIALLADRDVVGDGVVVPFFDGVTKVPSGPAVLALRTKADLLPCAVYQVGRGSYQAVVHPPLSIERTGTFRSDVTRLTRDLTDELAAFIARAPEQWHVLQHHWIDESAATPARALVEN